ncbi:dTDP-glucose 4,6-dehydratase [Thermoplasmatales archaeon SCGC AB-539-C06]|nr:dTDP-glucose 4,6-dehydratase [Thermoplasmatales archaeon SCGC AB-539-C06]
MKVIVSGGAGFIGSNFIHYLLRNYSDVEVVNYDKLTYAGNLDNLKDVENDSRYTFVKGDICDAKLVEDVVKKESVDQIVNFAAESHVDRSITGPEVFIKTDILGSFTLLEACRKFDIEKYIQISTDEVYGSIEKGSFTETDSLNPSSPYSASKTSADLLVNSYFVTYGLPVCITRSSNNFGPYQYPEKLIPFFIIKALHDESLPLYGDGLNVRDWLYVEDNCRAIDLVRIKGKIGDIYNIGADNEHTNIEITNNILKELGKPKSLISFVKDRLGHDRRYSIDSIKIQNLGWSPSKSQDFENSMKETICWYVDNERWWKPLL